MFADEGFIYIHKHLFIPHQTEHLPSTLLHHHPPIHVNSPPHLLPGAQRTGVLAVEPRPDARPVEGVPALEDRVACALAQTHGAAVVLGQGRRIGALDARVDDDVEGEGWASARAVRDPAQKGLHQEATHLPQHGGGRRAYDHAHQDGVQDLDAPCGGRVEADQVGEVGEEGLELGVQGEEDEHAGDCRGEGLHGGGGVLFLGVGGKCFLFLILYLN